jgi:serine/threonine-protein kinase
LGQSGVIAEGCVSGQQFEARADVFATTARPQTLGKYRVIAELGRGGMGIAYLALARGPGSFSKLLVLKELRHELVGDDAAVRMFMEEARLAACLSHPNVVQTIEAGSEGHRRYIAMEYVDGQSLHTVVTRARKLGRLLPFAWRTAVLCSAIEGLAYAHSARGYDGKPLGIVHRDMSPHNVMVGYDGHVKVLDFGIAKASFSSAESTGVLKGKVSYMSPEQVTGAELDARADVFAVGVMIWEAAMGRRFWAGMENDAQILQALLKGQVGATRDRPMSALPGQLQHVVARATAADPAQRYESATILLSDLRVALESCGVPSLGRPEIGHYALELFAEDRAKLQASIDQALERYGSMNALPALQPLHESGEHTVHDDPTVDLSGDAALLMSLDPTRLSARPSQLQALREREAQ